jgi:5'-nucleotidase
MRILVCNDDGVDAPGLMLLATAARAIADDVWIVAPERKWTAASHQLSFDRNLTLTLVRDRTYACSGAPADCVVAAMAVLFENAQRPDLVLSGVNDKRNVGEDLAYSGTMAIAREAVFWGVPAIAVSGDGWKPGDAAQASLARLLHAAWETRADWAWDDRWLSINLPASLPAAVEPARVGRDKIASACDVVERSDDRIVYRIRRGRPASRSSGDENDRIDAGSIAIVRHRWHCDERLPDRVLAALGAAASGGL